MTESRLLDGLSHERASCFDQHFNAVFAWIGKLADGGTPIRQQAVRKEQQEKDTDDGDRNADRRDAEQAEVDVLANEHARDHQIRAGSDQCAGSAEDGGVVHGKQQLGCRQVELLGPAVDRRNHHGDLGGIVQKCAEYGSRCHGAPEGMAKREGFAENVLHQPVDAAGFLERHGHDAQYANGDQTFVSETGKGFLGRNDAGDHQHGNRAQENRIGSQARKNQRSDHAGNDGKRHPRSPIHSEGSSTGIWRKVRL